MTSEREFWRKVDGHLTRPIDRLKTEVPPLDSGPCRCTSADDWCTSERCRNNPPYGARPVEDRDLLTPLGTPGQHTVSLTDEELATVLRRRRAKSHPGRWRVGGSPGTEGRTLYQGDRLQGLLLHGDTAAWLAGLANAAVNSQEQL